MSRNPTVQRINKLLRPAHMRMIRDPHGYYYFVDTGNACNATGMESLYTFRIDPEDFDFVRAHINASFVNAGLPFWI
jgi:hypothetical protein